MKKNNLTKAIVLIMIVIVVSCAKDKDENASPGNNSYLNGVFVVNEGAFTAGNSSVSFFNPVTGTLIDDAFGIENARPLGDVAQSMSRAGNNLYIAVNNSQKVEVVDRNYFSSKSTIAGLSGPRYILEVSFQKIYISNWGSNTVEVFSTNGFVYTGSIPTGTGPEQMLLVNSKIYVANVGGYGIDSTVTIINATNDQVLSTLQVGINPNSLVLDANNKLWVLCGGTLGPDYMPGTADDAEGKLLRIDPSTDIVEATFAMGLLEHPLKLTTNAGKTELFYLMSGSSYDGSIYQMNINSATLPAAALVIKSFYGLGIHPQTGEIYGGYSPAFDQKGFMFRYQSNGTLIDSVKVGIGPNGFYFNY